MSKHRLLLALCALAVVALVGCNRDQAPGLPDEAKAATGSPGNPASPLYQTYNIWCDYYQGASGSLWHDHAQGERWGRGMDSDLHVQWLPAVDGRWIGYAVFDITGVGPISRYEWMSATLYFTQFDDVQDWRRPIDIRLSYVDPRPPEGNERGAFVGAWNGLPLGNDISSWHVLRHRVDFTPQGLINLRDYVNTGASKLYVVWVYYGNLETHVQEAGWTWAVHEPPKLVISHGIPD
jgi:hypothetical protein